MNRRIKERVLGVVVLTVAVLCGCSSGNGTRGLVAVASAASANLVSDESASTVPVLRPHVLATVPHDPEAFTEGLELHGDTLYEGTGLEGQSQLREVDPTTGTVRRAAKLPEHLFGEGISVVGDRIWQLTWQNGVVLEWDRATLALRQVLPLAGEGWGLCYDGHRMVRSDGTNRLRFHDPATFAETGSVAVTLNGTPVPELNELECVGGQVWANVFPTDQIVRIDPTCGQVTAVVDASGLLDPEQRANEDAVLNGIAAAGRHTFLLTGKQWPVSFLVRFVPTDE